jgi:hypothetical protein
MVAAPVQLRTTGRLSFCSFPSAPGTQPPGGDSGRVRVSAEEKITKTTRFPKLPSQIFAFVKIAAKIFASCFLYHFSIFYFISPKSTNSSHLPHVNL